MVVYGFGGGDGLVGLGFLLISKRKRWVEYLFIVK